MSTIAEGSLAGEPQRTQSQPLIGRGMLVLFVALIFCFTAWGIAQDLTTPMVAGFKRIFDMSTFQASLVQLAYFGRLLPARVARRLHQPALRLQDRDPDRPRPCRDRCLRLLPGEQDHDLRGVPGRPVRDGRGLLDPRDL